VKLGSIIHAVLWMPLFITLNRPDKMELNFINNGLNCAYSLNFQVITYLWMKFFIFEKGDRIIKAYNWANGEKHWYLGHFKWVKVADSRIVCGLRAETIVNKVIIVFLEQWLAHSKCSKMWGKTCDFVLLNLSHFA
jgi:hypothetical protein